MKFSINKSMLLSGLHLAQGIADRKSTMPILANVLIRTDGKEKLLVAATDLSVTVTTELVANVEREGGLTVGARHLHEIVKSLPGEEMNIERAENHYAHIRAGKVEYNVVGMPDRDFPKLPRHQDIHFTTVDANIFSDMIAKTFFSISTDETRYHLNGVLFECDGAGDKAKALMVSTDGHRLSKVEKTLPGGPRLAQGIIIPRKGLLELRKALEGINELELGFHQGYLFARLGPTVLSIKLIDAQFPPYEQVIPKDQSKVIVVDRVQFLEALRRVSIMASDKTCGVKFTVEPQILRVQSDNPDLGQGREDIDVDYDGPELSIGFNARYFIELLGEFDTPQVKFELNGELDPGVVKSPTGEHYLGVIMPMRI